MEVGELVRLGKDVILQRLRAGELSPKHVWVAIRGAAEYREAVNAGDIASAEDAAARFVGKCLGCRSRTCTRTEVAGIQAHWCGPSLEEHKEGDAPTCGCLLGVTVDGVPYAGGRTVVASAECWQRQWSQVARVATMVPERSLTGPDPERIEATKSQPG
jgi:hypothetical protein